MEGDAKTAQQYLNELNEVAENSEAKFRFHDARQLVGLSAALLEGEILRTKGDMKGAINAFRRAAKLDDEQKYDEPEPIPYAARHWLGAALLETGQYAEAEKEFRIELADHPHNVWSLHGLKAALKEQGKTDPDVEADFETSTARMDVWITTSIM
jgi:tetratricopeptide (TPR) repeat protein